MRKTGLHIVAVLSVVAVGFAQDAAFVARVEPATVAAGEQFEITFTLSGTNVLKYDNFKAPDFGKFVVLSGPNTSTSVQYVNGRMSSSLTFTYFLYAREPGTYRLGEASVEVGNSVLKTNPVTVEVTRAKPQAKSGAKDKEPQATWNIAENLFLRAVADKQKVRQGEQFIVTYKLYTRVNIENYFVSKAPNFEGFWAEDLEESKSPEVSVEVVDGKQYRVGILKRTALFATQSGRLKVSPIEVRCAVRVQPQRRSNDPLDLFNDPFFSPLRTEEVDIASNALTITVDPLPGSPPQGFTGAVGEFTLNTSLSKEQGQTGEPVTLTYTISGTGNVKLVSIPRPAFPADFEVYDPKVGEEITRAGGIIRGKKTAEYLIIPRNAGERYIEPISFVYFDLARNSYTTLRSPRLRLTLTPGKEYASGGGSFPSREEVKLLGEDIRFLKLSPGELTRRGETPFSGWFFAGLLLPPLVFLGALSYRRRQEKLMGNTTLLRSRKAGREASKRLKAARKVLAHGNAERYHGEIAKALFGYLGDKLGVPMASLSIESASAELKQRGVSSDIIRELTSCIERAEFARFAPGSDSQSARQDLLEAAAQVITQLERSLSAT